MGSWLEWSVLLCSSNTGYRNVDSMPDTTALLDLLLGISATGRNVLYWTARTDLATIPKNWPFAILHTREP